MAEGFAIERFPVLLVDDDPALLRSVKWSLQEAGFARITAIADSREVLAWIGEHAIGAVVLDLTMPHLSGQELLRQIRETHPEIPVIVMTGQNELETAVQCMRDGALDYLVKPVEDNRLVSSVLHALEIRAYQAEFRTLKGLALTETTSRHEAFAGFITQNKEVIRIFGYLEQVALLSHPVLVCGESGTGKELLARAVHLISGRKGPFVPVDIAAGQDERILGELFGQGKGGPSGAPAERKGLIAKAADGTVFLDEIGHLGQNAQARLQRLLQDGGYLPIDGDRPLKSRARVLLATACDLQGEAQAGRFRKDLFFKLDAYRVQVPPLRARPDDLPLLVMGILEKIAAESGRTAPTVPPELFKLLRAYSFPGNVGELELMCREALAQHTSRTLSLRTFKERLGRHRVLAQSEPGAAGEPSIGHALGQLARLPTDEETTRALEDEALRRAGGNQGTAAGLIGLGRQALNRRLQRRQRRKAPRKPR